MAPGFLRQLQYATLVPMQHNLGEVIDCDKCHSVLRNLLGEQQLAHVRQLIDD
jgi:hypothetical protein